MACHRPAVERLDDRSAPASIGLDFSGLGAIFTARHRSLDFRRDGKINARDLSRAGAEIARRVASYFPGWDVALGPGRGDYRVTFAGREPDPVVLGRGHAVYVESAWDLFRGFRPAPARLAQWLAQLAAHELGHQMGLGHEPGTLMDPNVNLVHVPDWSASQEAAVLARRGAAS